MKQISISNEVFDALQQRVSGFNQSPNSIIAALLEADTQEIIPDSETPILEFLESSDFRASFTDANKYLNLLAWVYQNHETDFRDFIHKQSSRRRYFSLSRDEIINACKHNQARQIPGTQYWAIMNIDQATKKRFLKRILVFMGYHNSVIESAVSVFGKK